MAKNCRTFRQRLEGICKQRDNVEKQMYIMRDLQAEHFRENNLEVPMELELVIDRAQSSINNFDKIIESGAHCTIFERKSYKRLAIAYEKIFDGLYSDMMTIRNNAAEEWKEQYYGKKHGIDFTPKPLDENIEIVDIDD